MAYVIPDVVDTYEDLPLTNFPTTEDTHSRMTDVTGALLPLVMQYNELYNAGNLTDAAQLLKDNPALTDCIFNADKYNQLRDALIAMQRYQLNQLDELYQTVAQAAGSVKDNPTPDEMTVVSYSAEKVESMFNNCKEVVLTATDWTTTAPYTQVIQIDGIKDTDRPEIACAGEVQTESQKKALLKNWGFVDDIVTGNNKITAYCNFKKPTVDLPLVIKGV